MLLNIMTEVSPVVLALTLFTIVVIPLSMWGVGVEKRFGKRKGETAINSIEIENQGKDIDCMKEEIKDTNEVIQKNHTEVMRGLQKIELQLKDKKDRNNV